MKGIHTTLKLFRIVLVLLALTGIGLWAYQSFGPPAGPGAPGTAPGGQVVPPTGEANPPAGEERDHLVLVTYFTTDVRCPTCLKIEKQSHEAIESAFAEELASGAVRFQTINFDQPANKHFAEDYELAFKTVVISDRRHGKEEAWAKFDEVWDLVNDPPAFATYLQDGVRKYLKDDSDA